MAEIEKEEVCHLVIEEVTYSGSTFYHLFSFIYIIQSYKEDCTILQMCWAARLSPVLSN